MKTDIERRKGDHLDLCATDDVGFRARTTLLEGVRLIHQSLPDLAVDDIDPSVRLLGKKLRMPLVIASMTGGTARAAEVNRHLAEVAEARGYAFGLGSQRAMQRSPDTAWTYQVREVAPSVLLLGNLGAVQARDAEPRAVQQLVREIGADALCVHMNPAMELVQDEGDRDFRGVTEAVARLVRELEVPVIGKETGNGISRETAAKLRGAGVRVVDVSGAGGTSWVGVETLRAEGSTKELGTALWDWGIPTAASVRWCVEAGLTTIATGGIRTGHDVARALALGASACGIARPLFQALESGGREALERLLDGIETEFRAVMLLTGCPDVASLRRAPRILSGELRAWVG